MKIRQILYVTLSFLAVDIGLGSYVAASTFELKETSQEISGTDSESGVAFHASLVAGDRVVMDLYIGTKRIHADFDYAHQALRIRSVSQANGTPVALSRQDILAFQKLGGSMTPKINQYGRHGDALTSLINMIASAPEGFTFDFTSGGFTNQSFTSICPEIGGPGVATYTLGIIFKKTYHKAVTVGPICYMPPALGRCGKGGGPDLGIGGIANIGWLQRFTQECLNHDACCDASKKSPPVCGFECADAFRAAILGFAFAPDCGTTAGNWTDNFGNTFVLTDDNSSGDTRHVTGTANVTSPPSGIWNVFGLRKGREIFLSVNNPTGPGGGCPAAYSLSGFYTGCKSYGQKLVMA